MEFNVLFVQFWLHYSKFFSLATLFRKSRFVSFGQDTTICIFMEWLGDIARILSIILWRFIRYRGSIGYCIFLS